jgi:hypothetical protein
VPHLSRPATVVGLRENASWVRQWACLADAKDVDLRLDEIIRFCQANEGISLVRPIVTHGIL